MTQAAVATANFRARDGTPAPANAEAFAARVERATWADAALLALILALLLWRLGSYGLYEPHEGHFAGVGREMVLRGDWITPYLNGAPYLNKPPLLYWMIAVSSALLGFNEWAARLPLALAAFGGVALAWHWARQLWGIRAGRMAAAMLAVTAGWYLFAHQLLIDILLSSLQLLALYVLWRATLHPEKRARWAAFYAVMGLMVLAKGLIGIVFPAAALLLFALWRRDWRLLRLCRPLTGLLVLLAVCGPWVALLEYRNPGTLYYLVVNEHIKRVLGSRWPPDYEVVKVSALGYVGMTLVWAMPWSMLLWQVCRFSRKETASGAPDHVRHAVLLLALGALLPVVLFLPMPARLIYYSLPALAPFALLAAGWWSTAGVEGRAEGRLPAAACLMVLGAAVFSAGVWAPDMVDDLPQLVGAPGMPHFVSRLAFLLGVGLLAGGALLAWRKAALALAALFVLLSAVQMYSLNGFGDYANVLSSKRLVEELRDKAGAEYTWVSEGSRELGAAAGIAYYLGLDAHGQARVVLVMEDDTRRPPPLFPGPKPAYLIDHERLNSLWSGAQPALFVTDVQRVDWEEDAPHLPEGELHEVPLPWPGQRRVYANKAAWQRLRP